MFDLAQQPGLLFVAATLLPLASFVLLLLVGALRAALRPHRHEGGLPATLFKLLGGDVPGRGPGYVALGAIALAFVCSFAGFVLYLHDRPLHLERLDSIDKRLAAQEERLHHGSDEDGAARKALQAVKQELEAENARWADSVTWASVRPESQRDPERGTILRVGFYIDTLAAVMFVMVTFIATLIHLFSIGYMSEELQPEVEDHQVHGEHGHLHRRGRFGRFFLFMSLFCFSMLNLVLADNLFQVFVSWELVGVCSYLLIGFYYERTSASNAANKAFITNRIGDAGFIIGLLILWTYVGTLNFQDIFVQIRAPQADSHRDPLEFADRFVRVSPAQGASSDVLVAFEGKVQLANNLREVKGGGRFYFDEQGSHIVVFPRGHFHAVQFDPHYHQVTDASLAELRAGRVPEGILKKLEKLRGEEPVRDAKFQEKLKDLFPKMEEKQHSELLEKVLEATAIPATIVARDNPRHSDSSTMPYWMLVAAGLGVFLGCVGKSAQFPLQVWLPDAMEGPTPVSALIHAATMVAAGVYLVGRCYPLFAPEALLTIAYTGAITLFVAATIALVMTDIKKVLAYSTVSQLGYMMLGLGVGGWAAGLFHLVTHAFFKALLFLGSGSVIYGCHHEQDMLKMGGLYCKMKITALTMLVGCLAIAGIPLFSGWYSKDAVLAHALGFASVHNQHFLLFLLPLLTAGLTTFYMFRMWLMTFTGKPRDEHVYEHAHETPWTMTLPLVVLAFFSVTVAWGWPLWNAEASALEHTIAHSQPRSVIADLGGPHEHHHAGGHAAHEDHAAGKDHKHTQPVAAPTADDHAEDHGVNPASVLGRTHQVHHLAGDLALLLVAIGLSFAFIIYYYGVLDPREAKEQFPGVHRFLTHKWYFDELYSAVLVRPALTVADWARNFDSNVIDGFVHFLAKAGVVVSWLHGLSDRYIVDGLANLLANVSYGVGAWLRGLQTGYLRSYVLFLVVAAVSIWVVISFLVGAPAGGAP